MSGTAGRGRTPAELSADQAGALRAVAAAGAGVAGAAVAQLTGLELAVSVPRVEAIPLRQAAAGFGGRTAPVAAVSLGMHGGARGEILVLFELEGARRILGALAPPEPGSLHALDPMQRSALLEVGNILSGAYLGALGGLLHLTLLASVPRMTVDMAGAVLDPFLGRASGGAATALVVATRIHCAATRIHCPAGGPGGHQPSAHLLLIPDPPELHALLDALAPHLPPRFA
ncbi:MAG TPA: chemotaxis protein CheC [Candidatus Polarisedimenticolia bacterium]|nr:chemotaxis protein CheC [Candidatus Polarisedimenticolia bacterium]